MAHNKKMVTVSIILSFFLLLAFFPVSCKRDDDQDKYMTGGPCDYALMPGTATIVSVHEQSGSLEIIFDFVPHDPIEADKYRFAQGSDSYQTHTFEISEKSPRAWAEKRGLIEGSQHQCVRMDLIEGTCTPLVFDFPDIHF